MSNTKSTQRKKAVVPINEPPRTQLEKGIVAYRRKSGTVYNVRIMRDGKSVSRTFDTLSDAKRWRDLRYAEHTLATADNTLADQFAAKDARAVLASRTLADVGEWYIDHALESLAKNNQETTRLQIRKLCRHRVADIALDKLTAGDVTELLADLKVGNIPLPPLDPGNPDQRKPRNKPLSDHTVYQYFCRISAICGAAADARFIPAINPTRLVSRNAIFDKKANPDKGGYPNYMSQEAGRRISASEMVAIMTALDEDWRKQRKDSPLPPTEYEKIRKHNLPEALPFFAILAETAMRPNELLDARWEDINWAQSHILRPRKRHDEPQKIPLPASAIGLFRDIPSYGGPAARTHPSSGPLWPGLAYDRFEAAWWRMQDRTGFHDIRIYDLRHNRLSDIGDAGMMTLAQMQAVSGHRTVQMLMRYWHADSDEVARKLSQVGSTVPSLAALPSRVSRVMPPAMPPEDEDDDVLTI